MITRMIAWFDADRYDYQSLASRTYKPALAGNAGLSCRLSGRQLSVRMLQESLGTRSKH
jgi:hypothetical protein